MMYAQKVGWSGLREIAEWASSSIVSHLDKSRLFGTEETMHAINRQLDWFDWPAQLSLPLRVERAYVMSTRANEVTPIHADGWDRRCALNMPLNEVSGKMQWFEKSRFKENKAIWSANEHPIAKYVRWAADDPRDPNAVPDHEIVLDEPAIVNIDQWHRVHNLNNHNVRFVLTIRFFGNPSFEETVARFTGSSGN